MSKDKGVVGEGQNAVQILVDELCDELGRSVAVDNPSFELLCASAQVGAIDQRRISAIIDRSPPPEPVPWMLSHGIQDSYAPVRLPANEEFGMLPRVCFPIRQGRQLSGYLWLFDEPPVSEKEIEAAGRTVSQLADILGAEDVTLQDRAELIRELTARTVVKATALGAVDEAVGLGHLPEDGRFTVHVLRLGPSGGATAAARAKDPQLELSRPRLGRPYLARYTPGQLTIVSRDRSSRDAGTVLASVGRLVRTGGLEVEHTGSAMAGSELELETARDRAEFAAAVSALLGDGQAPLMWEEMGTWRLLQGRPLNRQTAYELSDDARKLIQDGNREGCQTVVAYLDSGRNVAATSQKLSIHRATLHYRLERVRELLGQDALDDGWRAVSLHVALKLHHALQLRVGRR